MILVLLGQPQPLVPAKYQGQVAIMSQKYLVDARVMARLFEWESRWNERSVNINKPTLGRSKTLDRGIAGINSRYQDWYVSSLAPHLKKFDVFNTDHSIELSFAIVKSLLKKYKGDYKLAIASYNAGPSVTRKHPSRWPIATKREIAFVLGLNF